MRTVIEMARKLHDTLALYNGAGHALGWKTEKVDKLLDESKQVIKSAQQEPVDIAALVEGMEVSIDVSTGDHDSGNRLFGTVALAQENQGSKHGLILLVQDPEANFKTATPQPAQPAQQEHVACECHRCIDEKGLNVNGLPLSMTKMILCPECGNKRCPKASDHRFACSNSNDPRQPGSIYTSPQPAQREWLG